MDMVGGWTLPLWKIWYSQLDGDSQLNGKRIQSCSSQHQPVKHCVWSETEQGSSNWMPRPTSGMNPGGSMYTYTYIYIYIRVSISISISISIYIYIYIYICSVPWNLFLGQANDQTQGEVGVLGCHQLAQIRPKADPRYSHPLWSHMFNHPTWGYIKVIPFLYGETKISQSSHAHPSYAPFLNHFTFPCVCVCHHFYMSLPSSSSSSS